MVRSDLSIGECKAGEIPEIIAIERDSFPSPWSEDLFCREMTYPISRFLVARDGRHTRGVAGYLVCWLVADELHVHKIAVKRTVRGKGIASRLMAEALARAAGMGCRRATLEVRTANLPALRLYEKLGFVVKGVRPKYYEDTGEDALILWADLPAVHPAQAAAIADKGHDHD